MYLSDTSLIVRGSRDRIQRGGGSVTISSAGAPTIAPAAGQVVSITGPVSASMTIATAGTGAVRVAITDAGAATLISGWRGADRRLRVAVEANDDTTFHAVAGVGAGTSTEALRIVNAKGYVSVPARLGVGMANPSKTFQVSGDGYVGGAFGVGASFASAIGSGPVFYASYSGPGITIAKVEQTAANSIAPVLVVKGGATPGVGGDVAQFQDSTGAVLFQIGWNGNPQLNGSAGNAGGVLYVRGRGATPGASGVGIAGLWYDDAAKAFKYTDSTGTTRTITAA